MYLKNLHISNFRCFRDYTIEFAPGVTVLFGKNGSGKSTLIHAIHKALSFLMYSEEIKEKTGKGKKAKVIDVKTFRLNNPYPTVEGFSVLDCNYEGTKPIEYEINIHADAIFGEHFPLDWDMTGVAPKMSLRKSGYRKEFLELYKWSKDTCPSPQLPLLAYYSDGYPHYTLFNQRNRKEETKRDFHLKNSFPELGYTDWNTEKGFTNIWLERLRNKLSRQEVIPREIRLIEDRYKAGKIEKEKYNAFIEASKKELEECNNEISKISTCLQLFSEGDCNNMEVASLELGIHNRTEVNIVTPDRERYAFSVLPAGYKRLFYIALDLAYRSFLLSNGTSTDITGVAIIDEIDLHLHPELEQTVLERLTKTFTHIQFVVSTHSPLVLTGVETEGKPNVILHMASGDTKPEVTHDIYGIDYNTGIEDVMGVESKNVELDYMVNLCAYMKKRNKIAQAENIMKRILDKFAKNRNEVEKMVEAKEREL